MKKFLFFLLTLAIVASASAGINATRGLKLMPKAPLTKSAMTKTPLNFKVSRTVEVKDMIKAPVTEAPEGEVKTYNRAGNALYPSGQYITAGDQEGTIDLIFAADGKVWFKNIIYGIGDYYGDSYVYGTLSQDGTTITVPMGQSIYYSSSYEADVVLGWYTSAVSGTSLSYTIDADVTEAVYVIDGNTITLQNSHATPTGSNYPQYEGTGLGCYWTDDNSFGNFLEWNTVLTWIDPATLPTMPTDLAVTPAATTADVAWVGGEGDTWNLRWRPWTDLSGNPFMCNLDFDDEDALDAYIENEMDDFMIMDSDGDSNNWGIAMYDEGNYCFSSYSYDNDTQTALTPDNWLILPLVELKGVLKFSIKGDSSYPDNMMPYVCVGEPTSLDDFVALADEDFVTPGEMTEYTIDLSAYEGQMGRIAFRHYNSEDKFVVLLDNILIGNPNDIVEPAEWNYVNDLTETEYTIEGLTPETKYEVQVMAAKGEEVTAWTDIVEFTTLAEPAPNVYILGEVDNNSWAPNVGKQMELDEETGLYTAEIAIDGRNSGYCYFSFTTELAENNDQGGWDYIAPFRFGAVSDGNFLVTDEWIGPELSLTYGGQSYQIPTGDYTLTLNLTDMKLIINKKDQLLVGDVTGDGKVDVEDIGAVVNIMLGKAQASDYPGNANIAGDDDKVDVQDLNAVVNIVLGKVTN